MVWEYVWENYWGGGLPYGPVALQPVLEVVPKSCPSTISWEDFQIADEMLALLSLFLLIQICVFDRLSGFLCFPVKS